MIKDVMPHLVRHDSANFGKRAFLKQIVIERDACRAEQS